MKSRLFTRMRTLITAGVLVAFVCPVSRPIENPSIFNPADYSTVPPSSYQSNPISNPIAVDINGNLVITGNVRRGMHFRDTVPYGSTTSFRAGLGSSSLSSFLRDSAGTEDLGNSANRYSVQPYYLRSGTVATTRPGHSGVFGQEGTRFNNRRLQGGFTTGTYVTDSQTQTFADGDTSVSELLQGTQTQYDTPTKPITIVKSIRELQQLTQQAESNVPAKYQQLMVERHRKQNQDTSDRGQTIEEVKQDSGIAFEPVPAVPGPEHKQSSTEKYSSFNLLEQSLTTLAPVPEAGSIKPESGLTLAEAYTQANVKTIHDGSLSTESYKDIQGQDDRFDMDIVEKVKQQLEDLIKTVGPTESGESELAIESTSTSIGLSSGVIGPGGSSLISSESVISGLDELKGLSQADLSAKARDIRGPHSKPDTFSMSRFSHHFQEAQDHLRGGRYYEAANSFALASIYKPDEASCLAGRGHALLGAGEYISSALFLSRAIEADAEYVKTKIDLAAMLGGQHIIESRIADIKEWLLRSGSGKLDFLLGYVYYRMGRLGPAQQAIDAAYSKTGQSAAVVAVKKAVDDAIAGK